MSRKNQPLPFAPRLIPEADFHRLFSEAAAIKYAMDNSGFQDKTIGYEIGVDNATLSKAKLGQARLNDDALHALMNITQCEAPLYAALLRRGYDPRSLRRFETDVERENRLLRERIESMEHEREIERRALREILAGVPPERAAA